MTTISLPYAANGSDKRQLTLEAKEHCNPL